MPANDRIVVGVDASVASSVALDWAVAVASRIGVPLDVVHAWDAPPVVHEATVLPACDAAALEAVARTTLRDQVDGARRRCVPWPEVRPVLARGTVGHTLLERSADAAQLVVGSSGHGSVTAAVLGSVSRYCLKHAHVPVTVVPPDHGTEGDGRVVVGVDRTEPSYAALRWAAHEAGRRRGDLVVVHVFDDVVDGFGFPRTRALAAEHRAFLDDVVADAVDGSDVRPSTVEVLAITGGPARALVEVAAGASLLVVGHGRGLRHLLGSVGRHCVHHAPCPVTVVPGT